MNLLKHLWGKLCSKITLSTVLAVAKLNQNWLVKPLAIAACHGMAYDRRFKENLSRYCRLYIAYDTLSPGREAHEIMNQRYWLWAALWEKGEVHPHLMYLISHDHPEEYPVEVLLFKWMLFKCALKTHIQTRWYWYVIYSQLLLIGNI